MDTNKITADFETISTLYAQHFDIERTPDWFILKLAEEVGELTQSYLRYTGQARSIPADTPALRTAFEDEIADVFGTLLLIAKQHDVDIETAVTRKWLKYLPTAQ